MIGRIGLPEVILLIAFIPFLLVMVALYRAQKAARESDSYHDSECSRGMDCPRLAGSVSLVGNFENNCAGGAIGIAES